MIKKFFLLFLFFIGLGFLNFSNSEAYIRQNALWGYSPYDNGLDVNVFNKAQLGTQRFGNTHRLIALTSQDIFDSYGNLTGYQKWFFFWSYDRKPYFLFSNLEYRYQGFFKYYYLCDEILGNESATNLISYLNCSAHNITDNFDNEMGGFFDSITVDDYWAFDSHQWGCYGSKQQDNEICFSSSYYGKSVCFGAGKGSTQGCACHQCDGLQNSMNLSYSLDFTQVPLGLLGNPPGFQVSSSGNIDSSSGIGSVVSVTGNVVYKPCTRGKLQLYYEEVLGYSPKICYGGLDTFDILTGDFLPVPGTGKTIFQIYDQLKAYGQNPYDFYEEWLNIYKNSYGGNYYSQVLAGQPTVLTTFFDFYKSFGVLNVPTLVSYCETYFINDPNRPIIQSDIPDIIGGDYDYICGEGSTQGSITSSGSVVSVDWSGIGNINSGSNTGNIGSGSTGDFNTQDIYDGITFITDYFNKLKSNYNNPNSTGNGILPSYIVTFLLAIMLFNFLRK